MDVPDSDYSSAIVPAEARNSWVEILVVWLGFLVVVGIMAVGGGLAGQMSKREFFEALVAGNVLLGMFAALAGYAGARSGCTFNQLMAKAFLGWSWKVVSLYVPVVLIGWYGVEAAIFGGFLGKALGVGPVAQRVLMAASAVAFAVSAYIGFRALRIVSAIAVPVIIVLGIYALAEVSSGAGSGFGFEEAHLGLSAGVFLVLSTWIMGALTCVPDITRFSRSAASGAVVAFLGVLIGNSFNIGVGAAGAVLTKVSDPATILLSLGAVPLALLLSLANIWTTNDNNMYSAALNLSRMLDIRRPVAVLICMLIGAVFAAFNPANLGFLFGFLGFLGGTAPALGGVVLTRYFVREVFDLGKGESAAAGWAGWIAGSAVAVWMSSVAGVVLGFVIGGGLWAAATSLANRNAKLQRE